MTIGNYEQNHNKLYWVKDNILATGFPDIETALHDPDGLLAIGGDLSRERLLDAYLSGIFPWFNEGQPVLWWSPDPRSVLFPAELKIARSLSKRLRKNQFRITFNKAFKAVLEGCAAARNGVNDTWITNTIKTAYITLHESGYAHSVECWRDKKLVGGLYGLALGKVFFGESMFSRETDASKVALVYLTEKLIARKFKLIDCQVHSKHLQTLGAKPIPRKMFIHVLKNFSNLDKITDWN